MLVFGAQFAFGLWMNSRGFLWNDALSRATSALTVLYSTDPHLAAMGFVWMPLPTLFELVWVAIYPVWPGVVSSGFASTATTAVAGGATAALLIFASRALNVSAKFGWACVLVVSVNPMLFLFATNGMSEGVAAPFLVGAVCCLTLFWGTGQRRYISAASLMLALGFASLYQAVPYGAALCVALVLGLLFGKENEPSAPQGRWRAVEGLGLLLLVPSFYVAVLWVGANAVIMGDPLFFATSSYSNEGYVAAFGEERLASEYGGDLPGTLLFVTERTVPFLVPGVFLLLVRIVERRFWSVNTLSLVLLSLSVPLGLIAPQVYSDSSYGWLRFFMYPLFVAAGWGLYEVSSSRRRVLAGSLVLAGWVISAPVILWAMWTPALGQEEYKELQGLVAGETAEQIEASSYVEDAAPVADYIDGLPDDELLALDSVNGWPIAAQVSPEKLRNTLILTSDNRFLVAIDDARDYGLGYLLVPNPDTAPQDLLTQRYPRLWAGDEPGFELVEGFPETSQSWRLYRVIE